MPSYQENHHKDVRSLIKAYDELYFWQRWIFPRKLRQAITSTEKTNFSIYRSFVDNVWFFQRWLIGGLSVFSNSMLMRNCKSSELAGLIGAGSAFSVVNPLPETGQSNFDVLVGHANPDAVAWALDTLNKAGLLTGDAGQANRNLMAGHTNPYDVALALVRINNAGLLTGDAGQANRNVIAGHADPDAVANALSTLNIAGLLTGDAGQANFNVIAEHADPDAVAGTLCILNNAGLLRGDAGQANRNVLAGHANPDAVAGALLRLNDAGLLRGDTGQANFNVIAEHADPGAVARVLDTLNVAGLLQGDAGQAKFNALIEHTQILFGVDETRLLWDQIPRLTGEQWASMMTLCTEHATTPEEGRRAGHNQENEQFNAVVELGLFVTITPPELQLAGLLPRENARPISGGAQTFFSSGEGADNERQATNPSNQLSDRSPN